MARYQLYDYTRRRELILDFNNPFTGKIGEVFEQFLHYYSPDLVAYPPVERIKLARSSERTCRFCSRKSGEASFEKRAHVFPQLTGKVALLHDIECDICNEYFGTFENSFANYLGLVRSADAICGKKGVPSFKSTDGLITLRLDKIEDDVHFIDIIDKRANPPIIDGNSVVLTSKKHPYTPLHVLKLLYKIGYSLLKPSELPDYEITRSIIMHDIFDNTLAEIAQVAKFTLPIMYKPFAMTYKKKPEHEKASLPTKVVTFAFGRYAFQFFLINSNDNYIVNRGQESTFMLFPPYFIGDQSKLILELINLSQTEKVVDDEHSIILTFDQPISKSESSNQ